MRIKPIKTEADYEATLKEVERLVEANPGTAEADRLEVLTMLIDAYEGRHHAIPLPDPIEAILYHNGKPRPHSPRIAYAPDELSD